MRLFVLVVMVFGLTAVPLPDGPLQGAAWAQSAPAAQDGPTVRRMKRLFESRVVATDQRCVLRVYFPLVAELRATRATLEQNVALFSEAAPSGSQVRSQDQIAREADARAAFRTVNSYLYRALDNCNPTRLSIRVFEWKQACFPSYAEQNLVRLREIVPLYKQRADAAQAAGSSSTVNAAQARRDYLEAVQALDRSERFRPQGCDTPRAGDTDTGGETVELGEISGGPEEPDLEAQWSWIAGLWDIDRIGGQIEFRVEADGTLSAYIAATNQRMIDHGYAPGMQIARGYRMEGANGVTWRYWANGGEIFSAQYPNRGPGETWGTAGWINGGVIYLPTDSANVSFPALLANRLAGFTNPLIKPDTTALDTIIAEYSERTAALEEAGTHAERMQLVQSAIEALDSQSASSADAQRAAQMLGLLSERDVLRDNPQLAYALDTLEQSTNPVDEAAAWQTLVAHMAASGAHFAQPIRGNDYDEQAAAQMFRVVRYASTLQDDLRNARGAFSNSNMSRTTAALARLQGIASLAGNPSNQTASSLMDGIRNISARPGGIPGSTSAFEFPAAIATGLLDNTIAGVRASADALVNVGDAIGGDRAAERRAIDNARRVNTILSVPGYADSVLRSVGNRMIERIPFARTMANWFR